MKKILKKSLACMLAAILCLTACVGAMATVGAEGAITYAIADVTVNQGEEAVIDVTISNFADVAGLIAEITVPDAVASIDSVKLNDTVELVAIGETAGHYIVDGKTVKFVGLFNSLNEFGDAIANVDALEINIAVTIAANAEGEYPFAAPVFQAGTANEEILDVNGTAGKLIVTVPCKHTETKTEETVNVAATCTTDGSKTVVTKCAACDEVISTEEVVIKATGHTEETIPAVDATCTTAGATAGVKCSVCDTVITAPETVDALGHNWVDGDITYTDCTSNGNMAQSCSRCDATQTVAVDPKGHTEVAYEEVAATCTTVGYTGGKYCSECDAVIVARTEIPATGHTNGTPVTEKEVAADCVNDGSYDTVVYCTVCSVEVSRDTTTVPALGHNFGDNLEYCANECGTANPNYVPPVVCEHAKKTYIDNGDGTHTIGCEDCDYSVVATLDDSLSTALSPTKISIGNKFGFYYSLSLRYVEFDSFEFVSSKPELNTTTFHYTDKILSTVFKAEDATASYPTVHRYYFTYAEVALYEMSVPVTATVYVTKGDEIKYYTFAPMTLAQLGADKYDDSTSAATLKSLMADMLNLGTEAQKYFGTFKGTAGNALLACEKMPNELTTLDEQYFTDYEGKLNVIEATADAEFSATRLLIDAAPSLYFNWKEGTCLNPADLTFKATYFSIAQNKNIERVSNGADLMDSEKQYGERIGRYYFNFTSIDLYDADKTITYTITHKDGRVWTCVTSVETLLSTTVNTAGDTQKLHQATAAFAVATHNHWPNY